MVEAGEYAGETTIGISATQLGVSASRAQRVLNGWIELFESGPTPITDLEFYSRTPARLFNSLRPQTQLKRLGMKWGDYADLAVLAGMAQLEVLILGGAPAITSLEPLAALLALRDLTIEGTKRVTDYGPVGRLLDLEYLTIKESLNGPVQHADSLEFLRDLDGLKELLFMPRVDSLDYSPILTLTNLEVIHIQPTRGMSPTMLDLEWAVRGVAEGVEREEANWDLVRVDRPWSEPTVDYAREVRQLVEIDRTWSALLGGRLTRLEAMRWRRSQARPKSELVQEGWNKFDELIGMPWTSPPDAIHLRLFEWLEGWRSRTRLLRDDPEGEARRQALRAVARMVGYDLAVARRMFEQKMAAGLLGPDDEAAVGLAATD